VPTLDEFKEKQAVFLAKKKKNKFNPKKFRPYLLQDEIVSQHENVDIIRTDYYCNDENTETNNVKLRDKIYRLCKMHKDIIFYIVELCESKSGLISGAITIKELCNVAKTTRKTIKKVIKRMIDDELFKRLEGKKGRGGFCVFSITQELKESVIDYRKIISCFVESDKLTDDITNEFSEEWINIRYSSLEKIGFSKNQLNQLYHKKLNTPEVIQSSINHFSFGLENRKDKFSKYTDPLSVLMSVLRDGGAWIEKDYLSPQNIAIRKVVEEKRRQKEEYDKMIKELVDLEFPEWRGELSDEDIRAIVPEQTLKSKFKSAITSALTVYFTKEVLLPRLNQEGVLESP